MMDESPGLPPRSVAQLQAMIVSGDIAVSRSFQSVLEIGFQRPEIIAYGNARTIATRCGLAPSTVWRIAYFLGFASFKDFKRLFRDDIVRRAGRSLAR